MVDELGAPKGPSQTPSPCTYALGPRTHHGAITQSSPQRGSGGVNTSPSPVGTGLATYSPSACTPNHGSEPDGPLRRHCHRADVRQDGAVGAAGTPIDTGRVASVAPRNSNAQDTKPSYVRCAGGAAARRRVGGAYARRRHRRARAGKPRMVREPYRSKPVGILLH
eukprot:COSAG02_NODE_6989_length_3244_cov_71.039110_4_plen_166_part_00